MCVIVFESEYVCVCVLVCGINTHFPVGILIVCVLEVGQSTHYFPVDLLIFIFEYVCVCVLV